MIIGCDFHTRTLQIAMLDTETGEGGGASMKGAAESRGFLLPGFCHYFAGQSDQPHSDGSGGDASDATLHLGKAAGLPAAARLFPPTKTHGQESVS